MWRGLVITSLAALIGCGDEEFRGLPDAPVIDRDAGDGPPPDLMPDGMMPDSMMMPDGMTPDSTVTPDGGVDAGVDSATPDTPADTATPDTATPDSATPDSSTPDTATPDTATPDSATPDSSTPDTFVPPDSRIPDTVVPDTFVPDASVPDTFVPDTFVPDTRIPDTFVPDAGTFDAAEPDTVIRDSGSDPDSGGGDPDAGVDAPTDGGVTIPACAVDTWCSETPPVAGKLLSGVWATSANDVFVVGSSGTILHRTNSQWRQMTSNTTADLRGVWAASSSDVWAVGAGGTIRRFDGSTWRTVSAATTLDFDAVWGSGPNDVWISGFGAVVHWNGTVFETRALAGELFAISGTGPLDVWTTGENAFVDRFTGTWTTGIKPDGSQSTFFAVHAISPTNVFVSSFIPNKETLQWNGTSWVARPCKLATSGCIFQGFFSTSATNVWGVGGSKVGHWDGTAWTAEAPLGGSVQFWDVSGAGSHIWVVGSDSVILHRN